MNEFYVNGEGETEQEPDEPVPSYGEDQTPSYDPFDGEGGTNVATLITLMRIYDVLLAQYAEVDDEKAGALLEMHAAGRLVASMPQLQFGE